MGRRRGTRKRRMLTCTHMRLVNVTLLVGLMKFSCSFSPGFFFYLEELRLGEGFGNEFHWTEFISPRSGHWDTFHSPQPQWTQPCFVTTLQKFYSRQRHCSAWQQWLEFKGNDCWMNSITLNFLSPPYFLTISNELVKMVSLHSHSVKIWPQVCGNWPTFHIMPVKMLL